MSGVDDVDLLERDVRLGWMLYEARPTDPEIAQIALRVLAGHPELSGMRILLAKHRYQCGQVDEARELLQAVVGANDEKSVGAARELVSLELHQDDPAEAQRWGQFVLRANQDRWLDWMDLGGATALTGEFEDGWRQLDDAVEMCARTDADSLPVALVRRAMFLFQSAAPPERLVPAVEEAVRADPTDEFFGDLLVWAYMLQGRFAEAEEQALRLLRLNPTDESLAGPLTMIRNMRASLAEDGQTLEDFHRAGVFDRIFTELRDQRLGFDLASALHALDEVLPAELRATLLPPVDQQTAQDSPLIDEIGMWHAGQTPGAGPAWGLPGEFRLMTPAEITAMDEAIAADPASHPQWQADSIGEQSSQVMTDDAGGCLIELMSRQLVIRRSGADDVVVAPSLAAWVWDRVAAFGGRDPRPHAKQTGIR